MFSKVHDGPQIQNNRRSPMLILTPSDAGANNNMGGLLLAQQVPRPIPMQFHLLQLMHNKGH